MSLHEKNRTLKEVTTHGLLYWFIYSCKETIKDFFQFICRLNGYRKLDRDYGYDPDTYRFIISNYSEVLCSRTKFMSKPTYYAVDIIAQLDEWYEEQAREE